MALADGGEQRFACGSSVVKIPFRVINFLDTHRKSIYPPGVHVSLVMAQAEDSSCRLLIVLLFRGSCRFDNLILSHHSRFTCECNKEEINDHSRFTCECNREEMNDLTEINEEINE